MFRGLGPGELELRLFTWHFHSRSREDKEVTGSAIV